MTTREAILNAARAMVQTVGANAMSYQDLADQIGIKKASIHHHFPTKAHLMEALIEAYGAEMGAAVGAILSRGRSGLEQLHALTDLYLTVLTNNDGRRVCVAGMLGAEVDSLSPRGRELLHGFVGVCEGFISTMLERGAKDATLKPQQDYRASASQVLSSLQGGLLMARIAGGPDYFRRVVDRLIDGLKP